MESTVVLLEAESRRLATLLEAAPASPGCRYRIARTGWHDISTEWVAGVRPALMIADLTAQNLEIAGNVCRWLARDDRDFALLVLMPDDARGEPARLASAGADDVMWDPVTPEELRYRMQRVLGPAARYRHGETVRPRAGSGIIGGADCFRQVIERIEVFAKADCPVLIEGETGTGKEVCARAIHDAGPRNGRPFVPVDCAAIPDHLFENELFGHSRGAFTDAKTDQRGLVALAEGGTLFMDEVDALSLTVQAKLLRFLQERTYRPLGADTFRRANVNVLTATNQDVEHLIREKRFRSDLYFRLNVFGLSIPPLRARTGDVELLAHHFLASCRPLGPAPKALSPAALCKLVEHPWPGNVRELLNVVQRAMTLADGGLILPSHIQFAHQRRASVQPAEGFRDARRQAIAAFERAYVAELFFRHGGNVTQAAREARKDRRAFGRLVKKYGLSASRV